MVPSVARTTMLHFVQFGYENAREAFEGELLSEVTAEFAEQLVAASWWRRMWLKRQIRRETISRLHKIAPPDACY